jgi:site-specific DNA recombinase
LQGFSGILSHLFGCVVALNRPPEMKCPRVTSTGATAERIRDKVAASKRKGLWMGGSLPLGYDPPMDPLKARVLEVNQREARTVQALFALYLKEGTLNATREAALAAGLSPRKADHSAAAREAGVAPAPFSYGQLHYLLTNPVYRGLIRHKALVHPGQHAPIIDAATWEAVQAKLQTGAARKRRLQATALPASATPEGAAQQTKPGLEPVAPLATKLYDDTGDRLTPSHTNRHNRRFRYYVSRRLITTGRDPSGWRLPAPQLEALVLAAVRDHFRARATAHDLLVAPEAGSAQHVAKSLADLADTPDPDRLWPLIEAVHLQPGRLRITLDRGEIAGRLGLQIDQLTPASTGFEQPFTQRRRGVETRLVSGHTLPRPDPTLQQNLARAHGWVRALRAGQSLAQIAATEGRSESAIRSRLTLAFLAPQDPTRHPERHARPALEHRCQARGHRHRGQSCRRNFALRGQHGLQAVQTLPHRTGGQVQEPAFADQKRENGQATFKSDHRRHAARGEGFCSLAGGAARLSVPDQLRGRRILQPER